jgi:hypothetical protein
MCHRRCIIKLTSLYLLREKEVCWLAVRVMLNTLRTFSPQGIFVFFKINAFKHYNPVSQENSKAGIQDVGVKNQLICLDDACNYSERIIY